MMYFMSLLFFKWKILQNWQTPVKEMLWSEKYNISRLTEVNNKYEEA